MRPFLERYPPFLRNSPEFRDMQEALEPELLELWEARDSALDQLCVETAGWGLPYWEKTLGLPTDAARPLEARRNRVKARLLGTEVSTVEVIRRLAESFAGGEASVTEYPERFWVELGFPGVNGVPANLETLAESLREVMPAHLGWGMAFAYGAAASLSVAAHAELCAALELWPQVTNELESESGAALGALVEYHRSLDLYPISTEEEESV